MPLLSVTAIDRMLFSSKTTINIVRQNAFLKQNNYRTPYSNFCGCAWPSPPLLAVNAPTPGNNFSLN
jgi:hypothetical protein